MAWATIKTGVMNPADIDAGLEGLGRSVGRKVKKMAKRLSDKQIKWFGTKRQKAALAARRSAARSGAKKKKSFSGKKASHRPRSRPVAKNPAPALLALHLGNAAPKQKRGGKKVMAQKKKSGGFRPPKKQVKQFQGKKGKRKGSPAGLGSPMDWVTGGVGVLAGVVGTRAIPQMVLGPKNTGGVGYLSNALVAGGLGWLSYLVFPRQRVLTATVLAGGFAALLARVIGDFTNYGKYLTLTGGVGDYMISNAPVPSRLIHPNSAMVEVPGGWGPGMAPVMNGTADTGVDLGRRAGVC